MPYEQYSIFAKILSSNEELYLYIINEFYDDICIKVKNATSKQKTMWRLLIMAYYSILFGFTPIIDRES